MNRFTIFLYIAFGVIICNFIISCEGDDATDTKPNTIVFNGITMTDNNGWVIKNDPNDWKLAETWTEKENSLFVEKMTNTCNAENTDYKVVSYPNPCYSKFNLYISKPTDSRYAFRIVDRNYNVLLSQDSVFSSGLSINVQGFGITNDTVRIYYKILGPDCELKGHGDIKIE